MAANTNIYDIALPAGLNLYVVNQVFSAIYFFVL
jgi:hypothetical protein